LVALLALAVAAFAWSARLHHRWWVVAPDGSPPREEVLKLLRQELSEKDVSKLVNLLQEALKDYRPNRDEP
jgi:hypothetical protein